MVVVKVSSTPPVAAVVSKDAALQPAADKKKEENAAVVALAHLPETIEVPTAQLVALLVKHGILARYPFKTPINDINKNTHAYISALFMFINSN